MAEPGAGPTDDLDLAGLIAPGWRAAFEETPRHVFVPVFEERDGTTIDSRHSTWLDRVYTDDTLVIRHAAVPGADGLAWPISSSTMPSLMARMLGLLDVHDGHRVLEIGTGTGYNAALVCHRLGDQDVTSIDIDAELVANGSRTARERLASLGYRPHLSTGHGGHGVPERAPFDRIIATAAVPAVPAAWVEQLADDGLILTDLRGDLASSLITLRKTAPDTVTGRFLAVPGHFMWLRADPGNPLRAGGEYLTEINVDDPRHRATDLDPGLLDDPDLRFLLQRFAPEIEHIWRYDDDSGHPLHGTVEVAAGPSRARLTLAADLVGRREVTETGPDQPWARVESIVAFWQRLDRPTRHRFGLTATADGQHTLWLDTPDSRHTWPLATGRPPARTRL